MTKSDGLTGRVVGKPGTLPPVLHKIIMTTTLLERVVGAAEDLAVENIKTNEPLMLSVGTGHHRRCRHLRQGKRVRGRIEDTGLRRERPAGGRFEEDHGKWRLIGFGIIQ